MARELRIWFEELRRLMQNIFCSQHKDDDLETFFINLIGGIRVY